MNHSRRLLIRLTREAFLTSRRGLCEDKRSLADLSRGLFESASRSPPQSDPAGRAANLDWLIDRLQLSPRQKRTLEQVTVNNTGHWVKACQVRPSLLKHSSADLLGSLDLLTTTIGISKVKAFGLLRVLPDDLVVGRNADVLTDRLSSWMAFCDKHGLDAIAVLVAVPDVLLYDSRLIDERFEDMSAYFANAKEVNEAIRNVPEVLTDHWNRLGKKLDLLIKEMQVFPGTLAKTKALSYDSDHIRARYEFLDRCGIYRRPSPKSLSAVSESYPAVNEIVETDLSTFIESVASNGLTVEEFELFTKLADYEFDDDDDKIWHDEHGYEDPD